MVMLRDADLRGLSSSGREVPLVDIMQMAKQLGMVYVETSALTSSGVKNCFDVAVIGLTLMCMSYQI